MASVVIDLATGVALTSAIKAPCRVATTANITLAGLQTIDAVAALAGDRVLVKNQSNATNNGIWIADTGPWSRAPDFDSFRDVVEGVRIWINDGAVSGGTEWVLDTASPVPGSTELAFSMTFNKETTTDIQAALDAKADKATTLSAYGITDAAPSSHVDSRDGHPLATSTLNGLMPATAVAKLAGVEAEATANSSDDTLLDRANHIGTQAISTVAGLQTALDGKAVTGANSDITSLSGLTTALSVAQGGTSATTAGAARTALGAAASGANSDVTSLSGLTTALSIAQGGTGATSASAARTSLGLGTAAELDVGTTASKVVQLDASARLPAVDGSALTGISAGSGAVLFSGAQTLSAGEKTQARANIGAAASGANSDITDLSGLTTALSIAQGGTAGTTAATARSALGAAASGSNSDITSLASLTTLTASGLATVGSLNVGAGNSVLRLVSAYATLDFPSIAAGSNGDLTITVTGATVGDSVALGLGSAPNVGLIFQAFVSATNTVTVRAHNKTAGAINIGAQNFRATVLGF